MDAAVRQRDRRGQEVALPDRPTIFARSTGALPSAIAVVRISGGQAGAALAALTGKALPQPRRAVVRRLHDADGGVLDDAMVLWLPGPGTATGEDLVELHLHGSRAVVAGVEAALAALPGLRAAEAGAFTRRAFENARMDLSQVEGLADLLAAETSRQRAAALAMSEGGLRRQVEDWQAALLGLAARVEAAIDHDDEADVEIGPIDADTVALAAAMDSKVKHGAPAERLRDGVRVGIAGPPNAGKSTLINALLDREAAIVSAVAGTTRDVIEVPVDMGGLPLVLIDMAGLRDETSDAIERIGISRAQAAIARADVVLWLGPPEDAPPGETIVVAAKIDAMPPTAGHDVAISAVTGEGMGELRALLMAAADRLLPVTGSLALSAHQRAALDDGNTALTHSIGEEDLVLRAESLRAAMAALDRITGRADTEAMFDALFARFCIGK